MDYCLCPRPDLWDTGDSCCCIGCGLVAAPETKLSRKRKAEEAEIITNDNKRAAHPLSSRTPFNYKKLEHTSTFRLLRLFPGHQDDEIACEIFHADISDPPDYEAVSYTWGSTALTQQLHTTEGLIRITENCFSALKGLRDVIWERILWVDAVCIAQENNAEKNHQIPLMAKIFSGAAEVLIYLGDETAMEGMEDLFALLRGSREKSPGDYYKLNMAKFLSLPWFSRIWVLQEVAMAHHAQVIVGSSTLDWSRLSIANIHVLGLEATDLTGQVPAVLRLSRTDSKLLKDPASVVAIARSCLSTDPRDRIYALLNLVHKKSGIEMSPDYTKTPKEVYTEFTVQFLKVYNSLSFLSEIGNYDVTWQSPRDNFTPRQLFAPMPPERKHSRIAEQNLDLPSWVPDYRHHPPLHSFTSWKPDLFAKQFVARFHECSQDHTNPCLEVRAIFVDKVQVKKLMPGQFIRLCDEDFSFTGSMWCKFTENFEKNLAETGHGATLNAIRTFSQGRRLALTEKSLAIVPADLEIGDTIAVLFGSTVPYLLRPSTVQRDKFQLLGECYLHGMKGPSSAPNYEELLGWFKYHIMGQGDQDGLPWQTIFLE